MTYFSCLCLRESKELGLKLKIDPTDLIEPHATKKLAKFTMPKEMLKRQAREIDAALERVQGNFVLAGKLLDFEPKQFRNAIQYDEKLRCKWTKGHRGRPPERLGFRVVP